MRCTDPSAMTPADRLAELADLFARGVQRFLAAEIKRSFDQRISPDRLDEYAAAEASCGSHALSPKNPEHSK